jgi:hypothetical protein
MVLLNLDEETIVEYACSVEASTLATQIVPSRLFGEGEIITPMIDENGGFAGYIPLEQIDPYTITIIQLTEPA